MSLLRFSKRVEKGGWTCPSEGLFYACAEGSNFVGCCTADPCTNGCPDGNIQPVSYNPADHGNFPDASCGTASQFWTCASGNKTFWGCCKSNPCAQGQACPAGDLTPAFLDRPEQFRAYVTDISSTSSATATPTASSKPDSSSGGSNTGAIVGGAVGGVLGLALIVAVLIFFLRRKKRNQKPDGTSGPPYDAVPTVPAGEKHHHHTPAYPDAPPVYTSPNPNAYTNPQSGYTTYAHYADSQEVQELPADMTHNTAHSPNAQRFSELPAGAPRTAELESPEATPKPQQTPFSPITPVTPIAKSGERE